MISRPASPAASVAPRRIAPVIMMRPAPNRVIRPPATSDGAYIASTCAWMTAAVAARECPVNDVHGQRGRRHHESHDALPHSRADYGHNE